MQHTCPYANTELLKPAIQFSTRGSPTSWKISSCKQNRLKLIIHPPILSDVHQRATTEFAKDHACVASVSATASKVNVCPLIDKESPVTFCTILSPSSLSLHGGLMRTTT